MFICYAGLIRGAIAFGLVLTIDEHVVHDKEVIVTTTLALILITTVLYGTTMGLMQRVLVPPKVEDEHEYDSISEGEEHLDKSEYEEYKHPNLVQSEATATP